MCDSQTNNTPLGLVTAKCDVKIDKALIEGGADITTKNQDGHTPLTCAVIDVHQEAADDCTDNEGDTPLIWVAQFNNPAIVGLPLVHGANINFRDRNGNSLLILAAQNRHSSEVDRILLEFGADVDLLNDQAIHL